MAFRKPSQKKEQPTITLPSLFGSHASMVDENLQEFGASAGWVILKD